MRSLGMMEVSLHIPGEPSMEQISLQDFDKAMYVLGSELENAAQRAVELLNERFPGIEYRIY